MPAQTTAPTRSLVTIVLLALALAGCQVRVDSDIELREDETAVLDLALGIMLQEGLPTDGASDEALTAEDAQEGIEESAETCGFDPAAASAEPYEADGFEGARVRLDGVSFDAITCFLTADEEMQLFDRFELSRDGDDFVLDAEVPDLAAAFSEGLTGQKRGDKAVEVAVEGGATDLPTDFPSDLGTELDEALQELEDALGGGGLGQGLENPAELFEITVRVTFPGDISDHNATRVEGTTAIWELDGSGGQLMARGSAGAGGGLGSILPIVLIVLGLLLLGLIIALLLRRRGKGSSNPTDPSQPGYGAPPQGQPGYGAPQGPPGYGAPPQGQPGYGAPLQGPPGYGAPTQPHPGHGAVPAPDHLTWGQPRPGQQPPPAQPPSAPPPAVWGDDAPPPVPSPQDQPAQAPPAPTASEQPSAPSDEPGPPHNPNATRTFRPEDLLPPSDPPPNR